MRIFIFIFFFLFSGNAFCQSDTTQVKISKDSLAKIEKTIKRWQKEFRKKGIMMDGDTLSKNPEFKKLIKDEAYRKTIYPEKYSWEKALEFFKANEMEKYLWFLINIYPTTQLNKEYVIKSMLSFDESVKIDKLLMKSFFTYCFTDPTLGIIKRGKPVITHPELFMKKFKDVKEIKSRIPKK